MNDQFYVNPNDTYDRTDKGSTIPDVNPDPFTNPVPVNVDRFNEGLTKETDAQVNWVDEPLADAIPVDESLIEDDLVAEPIVHEPQIDKPMAHDAPIGTDVGQVALLKPEDSDQFRARWNEIQGMFVDEPRVAVQQADALVSAVMEQITQRFASEHSSLEGQWNQGEDVSTEDLRKALQQYRSFFNRLVV